MITKIMTIIDDLVEQENNLIESEQNTEAKRKKLFQVAKGKKEKEIQHAQNQIDEISADLSTERNKHHELSQDLEGWNTTRDQKQAGLEALKKACDDEISSLARQIQETADELDTIKQVIAIFKSEDIQNIKTAMLFWFKEA